MQQQSAPPPAAVAPVLPIVIDDEESDEEVNDAAGRSILAFTEFRDRDDPRTFNLVYETPSGGRLYVGSENAVNSQEASDRPFFEKGRHRQP